MIKFIDENGQFRKCGIQIDILSDSNLKFMGNKTFLT